MQSNTPLSSVFGKVTKVFQEVKDTVTPTPAPTPSPAAAPPTEPDDEDDIDDNEELLSDETAQALLNDIKKHGLSPQTCLPHTVIDEQLPEGESISDQAVFLGVGIGDYFGHQLPTD